MKKKTLFVILWISAAATLFSLTACARSGGQSSPGDPDGNDDIEIICERHTVTEWEITPDTHSGTCTTCGEHFIEPHYYHEGSTICEECGYDSSKG